jgi:hypothetical protein
MKKITLLFLFFVTIKINSMNEEEKYQYQKMNEIRHRNLSFSLEISKEGIKSAIKILTKKENEREYFGEKAGDDIDGIKNFITNNSLKDIDEQQLTESLEKISQHLDINKINILGTKNEDNTNLLISDIIFIFSIACSQESFENIRNNINNHHTFDCIIEERGRYFIEFIMSNKVDDIPHIFSLLIKNNDDPKFLKNIKKLLEQGIQQYLDKHSLAIEPETKQKLFILLALAKVRITKDGNINNELNNDETRESLFDAAEKLRGSQEISDFITQALWESSLTNEEKKFLAQAYSGFNNHAKEIITYFKNNPDKMFLLDLLLPLTEDKRYTKKIDDCMTPLLTCYRRLMPITRIALIKGFTMATWGLNSILVKNQP